MRTLSVYWYFCQSQPLKPLNPLIRFPVTFDSGPLKIIMRTLSKILNGPSHVVEAITCHQSLCSFERKYRLEPSLSRDSAERSLVPLWDITVSGGNSFLSWHWPASQQLSRQVVLRLLFLREISMACAGRTSPITGVGCKSSTSLPAMLQHGCREAHHLRKLCR